MRFKYETQASDSFIHNLNYVLLRLADPFMDAQCKKLDKIDLRYYERSSHIKLKHLTRINATPPEIEEWEAAAGTASPSPNFISDVFYLLAAVNHLSTGPIAQYTSAIERHVRDIEQQLEMMDKDETWRWVSLRSMALVRNLTFTEQGPAQAQVEAAIKQGKVRFIIQHFS
jgi:ubiquitin conjugation factor E4 B